MKHIELLTFSDRLLAENYRDQPAYRTTLTRIISNPNCDQLIDSVRLRLSEHGIQLGKLYGIIGIGVDQALVTENYDVVLEIRPEIFQQESPLKLKYILENYEVLLSDIMESGFYFGYMLDYIKRNNIKIKKAWILGTDIYMADAPEHNIYQLRVNLWPWMCLTRHKDLLGCVYTKSQKDHYISIIKQHQNPRFCLFPNRKPRLGRIQMLSRLHSAMVLDRIDWSLEFYYLSSMFGKSVQAFDGDHINLAKHSVLPDLQHSNQSQVDYLNKILDQLENNLTRQERSFLNSLHLPKFIETPQEMSALSAQNIHQYDGFGCVLLEDQVGSYVWNIVSETYTERTENNFGYYNHVTEKSYKAFYMGTMPLITGTEHMESHLRNQGFVIPENNYDHLSGTDRMDAMVQYISQLDHRNKDLVHSQVENFLLATNLEWLTSQIVDPLVAVVNYAS